MKFQPGQSGNPAGRPLGARNKKTIAMEEEFAEHSQEAVEIVMRRARGGDPTCLRLLMARIMPTGVDRPLPLELPKVESADDAQKALNMVIEAFGRGAITVRELSPMLGSVDRMARTAERIQQNRERERERYGARRVHGIHPDMIPKAPPGWVDPDEALKAAIERGENPFPDDPAKLAYILEGEELFPSVHADPASVPLAAPEGGSPGGGINETDSLYFSVNSPESTRSAISDQPAVIKEEERVSDPCSLITDHGSAAPGAADVAPPSSSMRGINEDHSLYSPVNSGVDGDEPIASENRPELSDGSRLVSALVTPEGRRMPVYLNPKPDPDPLAEVLSMVESMARDAEPPHFKPG